MGLSDKKDQLTRNRRWFARLVNSSLRAPAEVSAIKDIALTQSWGMWDMRVQNPLTSRPRSYWSQSNEDGIIEEITQRITLPDEPTFIEFGVDDGTECNSVALIARGWKGCWIGGQDIVVNTSRSTRLLFQREFVTNDNVQAIVDRALEFLGARQVNLCSIDLDGNDFHFAQRLLDGGFCPDIWVCEYNGTIPLGSHWVMPYDRGHRWARGTDYFGASYSAYKALFEHHGYTVVATSVTGVNMFMVKNDHLPALADVPRLDEELFRPSLPFLLTRKPFIRTASLIQSFIDQH